MTRGPRAVAASGYYHVVVRGNGKQVIFEDDEDRYRFLNLMRHAMRAGDIHIIAWCFMDNHVHLIVHDEACRLSDAMHALLSPYARYFNKRSNHVGHVFQDRFSAAPIEDDAYLLRAVAYVHANPAKAGAGAMGQYRWSSYDEYAHPGASEFKVVDSDLVLSMLGGPPASCGSRGACKAAEGSLPMRHTFPDLLPSIGRKSTQSPSCKPIVSLRSGRCRALIERSETRCCALCGMRAFPSGRSSG